MKLINTEDAVGSILAHDITVDPRMTTAQMADNLKISQRQVQKYLKRLQNEEKILRIGSRKNSEWKIIDEEYEGFFERI